MIAAASSVPLHLCCREWIKIVRLVNDNNTVIDSTSLDNLRYLTLLDSDSCLV
jgi:hypothetical protein